MIHNDRIAELEAELAQLKREDADARAAAAKAVQPVYQFTLVPTSDNWQTKGIWDESCVLYTLSGKVLNADEMKAVGNQLFQGSMDYLFNTATGKFIMSTGGGSIFLKSAEAFGELATFVVQNPMGGNVNDIVNRWRGSAAEAASRGW